MDELQPAKRRRSRIPAACIRYCAVALVICVVAHDAPASAVNMVRMEGILGATNAPGNVAQLTLAVGTKSVPFSVLSAQKISGDPAQAPEIFSALGPGPPPLRVEGRDGALKKIADAPADTRVTIIGNLDVATAFLTLMDVEIAKSAGAE